MGSVMIIFLTIIALVFLVTGGVGLFYVNTQAIAEAVHFIGNLAFGMFAFFGLAIIVFIAIFNAEFD
jgi:hypothetical protein